MTCILAARMSFVCASIQVVLHVQMHEVPSARGKEAASCWWGSVGVGQQDSGKRRGLRTGWGYPGGREQEKACGGGVPRKGGEAEEASQRTHADGTPHCTFQSRCGRSRVGGPPPVGEPAGATVSACWRASPS